MTSQSYWQHASSTKPRPYSVAPTRPATISHFIQNIPPFQGQPKIVLTDNGSSTRAIPGSGSSVKEPCCVCEKYKPTYTCVQCNNDAFCDDCWPKERPHRPGAVGMDGLPHEKTDREIVDRLRDILEPIRTPEQQQDLHKNDEDTTWFGIARDAANTPVFQDYGRYATIMTESQTTEVNIRYPQLVSFIGQTGAGKSTLIKMLIDKQINRSMRPNGAQYPSPVTGSTNDNIPTSGDVHLYSDPSTYYSATPMLYADCEGFEGGENTPHGARYKEKDRILSSNRASSSNDPHSHKHKKKPAHSTQRDIAWATTPETRKREYAVTQLYPRLLYTFSDVVVFVLRNSKVFESVVLEKLLGWASASIEHSLNQPALPHAIIALNASDIVPNNQQWDVDEATNILLSDIAGAIDRVPSIRAYAEIWRDRGKKIRTTEELLKCYYSSITVVRIPVRGRYMLMDDQLGKLHAEISRSCKASYNAKVQVRMLSNADKLQIYLQSAFDHFSRNLDTPFDFVKEAVKINPIPRDFHGNILKLAIAMQGHNQFRTHNGGRRIFQELSHMVASCIVLGSVRQGLLGTVSQLLDECYLEPCLEALDDFCSTYWTCEFQNKHGQCTLKKFGHGLKGHQNSSGKIFAAGDYQSNFDADEYAETWINNIRYNLEDIQRVLNQIRVQQPEVTEQQAASKLHCQKMNEFYNNIGQASDFISHSTCFSCLRELPEHPLPCKHVLCTTCVKEYGHRSDETVIKLPSCPLHTHETQWRQPWIIRIKPEHAGVRILNLDGGGVRGIVELEVLRAIERSLGGNLPIQAFFDLIVGTSTGGIIALGLGVENWPVEECINRFTYLCGVAFNRRPLSNIFGLERITTAISGSKYRAKPFEEALQGLFGEDKALFNGQDDGVGVMTKVAITTTTSVDQQPVVLTNYNRPDPPGQTSYKFERSDHPSLEFKTWEAARATSAAQPYFKAFTKNETKAGYIDGALHHNNPVWVAYHEHKLIWSDVSASQPDILLSIGTGHCGPEDTDLSHSIRTRGLLSPIGVQLENDLSQLNLCQPIPHRKFPTFTEQIWHGVANQVGSILNCSRIWDGFRFDILESNSSDRRRFIRINPDLETEVPDFDDVGGLGHIQKVTRKRTKNSEKIKEVAHRLIASTFFFKKLDMPARDLDNEFDCKGLICCRFPNGSSLMKELGRFLESCLTSKFTPYFLIRETKSLDAARKILISDHCIDSMCMRGEFVMDRVNIRVSRQLAETTIALCLREAPYPLSEDSYLPISGFPRALLAEDSLKKANIHGFVSRDSGSFNKHRHRFPALQKIKSQPNLVPTELPTQETNYPEGPEDVGKWVNRIRRSKSIGAVKNGDELDQPAGAFELADTSVMLAPSEGIEERSEPLEQPKRRGHNLRHLVV